MMALNRIENPCNELEDLRKRRVFLVNTSHDNIYIVEVEVSLVRIYTKDDILITSVQWE